MYSVFTAFYCRLSDEILILHFLHPQTKMKTLSSVHYLRYFSFSLLLKYSMT